MNPKENLLAAIRHQRPEWVPCPMVDGSWRVVLHNFIERPQESGLDDWGVYWERSDSGGGSFPAKYPLTTPEKIKDYIVPDVEKPDLLTPAKKAVQEINRSKCLVFADNGWGIFERAWLLTGMDNLLVWMLNEPETVKLLMEKIAGVKLRITERLINEISVDGIMYGDDWGSESSLIMGPELWRRFIKPLQQKLYDICSKNKVLIKQHSDGHIEEIFGDLVEIGLNILNPLQPECNDIEKAKSDFGKDLAFHGAVSSRLLDRGTPEQIKEEVRLRIKQLAEGGGYIIAPAHAFPYPDRNVEAFRNAASEYGGIPEEWRNKLEVEKTDIEV